MRRGMSVMERRENQKPNVQFIASIRGLYLTLKFLGLWPQTNSPNWYNSIWYIQSIGLAFELFGPTAGMIIHRHDARKIIDSLGVVVPLTGVCVKWAAFATRRKTFNKLLRSMEEDWNNLEKNTSISHKVPDSQRIMQSYSRVTNIFFYNNVFLATLAITNYVRDAFAARNSVSNSTDLDQLLPMPNSWYPLDYNRSFNIQFLALTQTITSIAMMMANAAMDSMFIAVTLHLCGQFKILRYFIENRTYDPLRLECCKTDIRLMVKRHQILISAGDRIQDTFGFLVLEQLMGSVLSVCFLGYELLAQIENTGASATTLLKTGFLLLTVVQLIFSYCFVGNSLTSQSSAIAMAVYNAEWYNYTRSINLSFSIIMIRATKPVQIIGAKILPMSLDSFMVLMKAAASYLSVLRAMSVGGG